MFSALTIDVCLGLPLGASGHGADLPPDPVSECFAFSCCEGVLSLQVLQWILMHLKMSF